MRLLPVLALAGCSFSPAPLAWDASDDPIPDAPDIDAKPDAPPEPDGPPPPPDADPSFDAPPPMPDAGCGDPFIEPVCDATDLGDLSGDTGADTTSYNGNSDKWFVVRITENSNSQRTTRAWFRLEMPSEIDWDLEAYCLGCGGSRAAWSENVIGYPDEFDMYNADHGNGSTSDSDNFIVFVHVKHYTGISCSDWNLTISGNVASGAPLWYCPN